MVEKSDPIVSIIIPVYNGSDCLKQAIDSALNQTYKKGDLCSKPQRIMLNYGDMIIAGEGNGPVSPEPKKIGALLGSEDQIAFDMTICKLMGFPAKKIPLIKAICSGESFFEKPDVRINICDRNMMTAYEKDLEQISFDKKWAFKPHEAWKNQI